VSSRAARVALIVAVGTSGGASVGKIPISLPTLSAAFDLSLLQASLTISFFLLAAMLVGIFGGMLADRFGQRRVMMLGLIASALGGLLGAASTSGSMLLASRAVESFGFIATVLPGPALLTRLVGPHRLRAVMGLWACYMPLGMSIVLILCPWLLETIGWRGIWVAIAAVSLLLAALVWRIVPPDPQGQVATRSMALVRQTIAGLKPWLLATSFAFYAGQWMSVFGFLPTLYQQQGVAATTAGMLTALGAAVNMIGNFGAGLLMQRGWRRHRLLIAAALIMLLSAWVIFGSTAPFTARYAALLAFSAGGGLIPGTLFASTPSFAPNASTVSTTAGLMQQGSAVGQFLTPPLIALMVSSTGNWSVTWLVTGAMACANIALALVIRRQA
jgi:CP family cyanate transporter-like MFS transporter